MDADILQRASVGKNSFEIPGGDATDSSTQKLVGVHAVPLRVLPDLPRGSPVPHKSGALPSSVQHKRSVFSLVFYHEITSPKETDDGERSGGKKSCLVPFVPRRGMGFVRWLMTVQVNGPGDREND